MSYKQNTKARADKLREDEPSFLLRAQDKHFCSVVGYYAELLKREAENGSSDANYRRIKEIVYEASTWQLEHGCRTPD